MRQLTLAIAGAGARAQQHLETLVCLPQHFRVVAVSDARRERADAMATACGATAFADPVQMLDQARPDALFIIVPPDGHHPLTLAAAERGVHVLCEVPISITLPLADLMINACRRAGVVLEICENVPRRGAERLKREVVQRGLIGDALLARLQYASGAYHGISAVRRLLPGRPTRVVGFRRTMPAAPQLDFTGLVQDTQDWELGCVTFAGGAQEATLLYEQPPRPGARNGWEVVGSHGRITDADVRLLRETPDGRWRESTYPIVEEKAPIEGGSGAARLLRVRIDTDPPLVWENPDAAWPVPAGGDDVARARQLLGFHASVTEGVPPDYGADEARTDLEVLLALRESARHGNAPVELPLRDLTDHERALHEEYRLTYGHDPLGQAAETAGALYPRGGITHGVTHARIGEIIPADSAGKGA